MLSQISPSTSQQISEIEDPCQVCGQNAHGNHFGVRSCRACAAFFSRAIIGKYMKSRCDLVIGGCEANKDRKLSCKKCRLERCIKAGMSVEKLSPRSQRMLTRSTKPSEVIYLYERSIPHSMESFLGRPHFLISFEPELASPDKGIIDVNHLLNKAERIVNEHRCSASEVRNLSKLGKLAYGLTAIRNFKKGPFEKPRRMGRDDVFQIWEKDVLSAASWLSYCDEYHLLPNAAKLKIVQRTWQLWACMEEVVSSLSSVNAVFEKDCNRLDVSWFSNYRSEQVMYFVSPPETYSFDVITALKKLQPTAMEQAYMLAQISFQFVGKLFQENILLAAERIHEDLSNDLHNYYIEELTMPNYSGRLAQLMRIANIIKTDFVEKMKRIEIARLFDIFKTEFSHPEMFYQYR